MGMVKAIVSLVVAVLLPATSLAVNVVDTVFSVTERTAYCALDKRAGVPTVGFWLQDFVIPQEGGRLVLRYTTLDPKHPQYADPLATTGNMSVYEERDGNVYVLAEYGIRSNEVGHPVWVDGIQQYPSALFSPSVVPPVRVPAVSDTSGTYNYCPVPRNAGEPPSGLCAPFAIDGAWYKYVVIVTAGSEETTVAEFYWQSYTSGDYARLFVYDSTGLVRMHDFVNDLTYYRYRSVKDGVCQDRYSDD